VFGESQAQELVPKAQLLPKDIEWHFIGHLQTNKVKYIIPYVSLIHAVDSLKLVQEINKQALQQHRIMDCLVQIRIAQEETKYGMTLEESASMLHYISVNNFTAIRICGVMGLATDTEDQNQVTKEFQYLTYCFHTLKNTFFQTSLYFSEISMGMTHDYPLAIEQGSTLIRVGSGIFGERVY
ncbi:MAG TPA: YggS family pyridoxal phosphate-dependent enzyme, partial [Paludibacteraceae bacterium]|nr:YggS family pyridoxal phosphate-dependent enzyme [Paludibacteraceae bacterium]